MLYGVLVLILSMLFLPNWLLLVLGIPLIRLNHTALISFGDADIRIYDVLILGVVLKVGCFIAVSKRLVYTDLYKPVGVFVSVLFGATLLSYYRFGPEVFTSEFIAFTRFLALFVVFFLTIQSFLTLRQLELADRCLSLFGYTAATFIYLGLLLLPFGVKLGEIATDSNNVRAFGILGDQVGFLLPLFLYRELIRRKILGPAFLGIAVLLTGTRGTLTAFSAGLLVMSLLALQGKYLWTRRYAAILFVFIALMGIVFSFDPGGMRTRLQDPAQLSQGLTVRGITAKLAAEVFLNNMLTGVGFSGFRFVALDYDAPQAFTQRLYYSPAFIATTANQYLQVATDAGILGFITFIWMMSGCLRVLNIARDIAPVGLRQSFEGAYVWLWSLLLGAHSVAWLLPDMTLSYILWIVMGMAIATIVIQQEKAPVAQRCAVHQEALVKKEASE